MKWKEKRTVKQWYEAASYEIARPQAVTLWAGFIKHFTLKVLVEGKGNIHWKFHCKWTSSLNVNLFC